MSSISYREQINPFALYAHQGWDVTSRPEMGLWWAGPPINRVSAVLAQHPGFVDVRYLAQAIGETVEALTAWQGPLDLLHGKGAVERLYTSTGEVVVTPPALAASWERTVNAVSNAIGIVATPYRAVAAKVGPSVSPTSLQCCLQHLADDGGLTVTPAGGGPWEEMSFRR